MECAEAIGLDEEYLKKIEEQKRLREEFARKRSEKRQEKLGKPFVKGPSPVRSHFDQKTGPRRGGEGNGGDGCSGGRTEFRGRKRCAVRGRISPIRDRNYEHRRQGGCVFVNLWIAVVKSNK